MSLPKLFVFFLFSQFAQGKQTNNVWWVFCYSCFCFSKNTNKSSTWNI